MTLNMNRLNLPNMVDNQLKDAKTPIVPTETYFNPNIVIGQRKPIEPRRPREKSPRTKITTSLNSIVANVHRQLNQKPHRYAPSIPPVIAEIETEPMPNTNRTKVETQLTSISNTNFVDKQAIKCKFNNNLSQLNKVMNRNGNGNTIPQVKANWEQKNQQRMRRNIGPPTDYNNYTNQQRVREVLRQKRILEDMLEEHQKLQRNRQTIAIEIQSMKNYLNEISGKLDFSLKKLNNKKTVAERYPRPKKLVVPIRNRNNNVNRPNNNNNNNNNNINNNNNNNANKQNNANNLYLSQANKKTNNGNNGNRPNQTVPPAPRNNQRNISLHPRLQNNSKKPQPELNVKE